METIDFMHGIYFAAQMRIHFNSNAGVKLLNDSYEKKIDNDEREKKLIEYMEVFDKSLADMTRKQSVPQAAQKWEVELYELFEMKFIENAHLIADCEEATTMRKVIKAAWSTAKKTAFQND